MTHTEYMRIWRKKNHNRYREICNKAWKKWAESHPDELYAMRKDGEINHGLGDYGI